MRTASAQIGAAVKRLYSMLGLAAGLVLSLAFPQRIYAAQTDTVTLENQGEQVAVSVNMANANKEKITAISMSLNVEVQDGNKDDVSFLFSQALEEAVKDYRYDKDRGVLSIYVASGSSLFDENDNLNLGAVRFQKADSADSLKAEVSVAENSIQTVNKAYGSKIPDIAYEELEPVIVDGNAEEKPGGSQGQPDNSQEQNPGSQDHGNQDSGDNINSGLYDETTQLVNDPKAAEKIPSYIIKDMGNMNGLPDLGKNGIFSTAPVKLNSKSGSQTSQSGNKVTIVDPEDGPSSILVSGENTAAGESGQADGTGKAGTGENGNKDGSVSDEILLDKEHGGVQGQKQGSLLTAGSRTMVTAAAAVIAVCIFAGAVILFRKKSMAKNGKRRKTRK